MHTETPLQVRALRHPWLHVLLAGTLCAGAACDGGDDDGPADAATETTAASSGADTAADAGNDDSPDDDADADADADSLGDDTAGDDTAGDDTAGDDAEDDDTAGDDSTDDSAGDTGDETEPPRVATLSVYLEDALARAATLDPAAELVQIAAFGLRSDGTINLVGDTGFVRSWVFGFQREDGTDFRYDFTPENALDLDFPVLEDPTGSIVAELPLGAAIVDSDVIASTFEEDCGLALTDNELDSLAINFNAEQDAVVYSIGLSTGESWITKDEGGVLVPFAEGTNPCF